MMHPNQRAAELIALLEPMIEILVEETRLLRDLRASEIEALQTDKAKLADSYRRAAAAAAETPAFAATLEVPLRDQLTALQDRLRAAVAENEVALKAAMKVNQKLIASFVGAAKDVQADGAGYTRQGATGRMPGPAVSIRINQKL